MVFCSSIYYSSQLYVVQPVLCTNILADFTNLFPVISIECSVADLLYISFIETCSVLSIETGVFAQRLCFYLSHTFKRI